MIKNLNSFQKIQLIKYLKKTKINYFNNNKIFIASNLEWEKDYFYHLLSNISNKKIYVFSSNDKKFLQAKIEIILFKPDIIFHFSDEIGNIPQFNELSKLTKLYLRQYSFKQYPLYDNIYIIPLGYQTGMFDKLPINLNIPNITERKYKWAFIGDYSKNDERKKMVKTISSIKPFKLGKANPTEMKNIYMNSIFIPNTRGNFILDCFRLYEATVCGSIPILVGPKNECEFLKKYQKNPPWPSFNNWDDAKVYMENYDNEKIQELQILNLNWWKSSMTFLIDIMSK